MAGNLTTGAAQDHDRFAWIDSARGIGIVAVVAGHVWTHGALRDALYSFHMPLFFLLSGYLFRPHPAWRFARRQIVAQGLTYLVYLFAILACDHLIEGMRGHRPIFSHWPQDLWPVLMGGSALKGPFTVFWFVPCLLGARIAFNAIARYLPDMLAPAWIAIALTSLGAGVGMGAITDLSPWGLLSMPMALFLLWAGAAGRAIGWKKRLVWLIVPLSLAGLFWFPPVNMKAGDYGWPILSLAGALATSALIFRIASLHPPGAALLRALGRGALVIMYVHVPVIHYLAPDLPRPLLFLLGLAIPYALYRMWGRRRWSARLFLAQP